MIKILIVEDEAVVAMDIESRLKDIGYLVIGIASSGNEALNKIKEIIPDLILIDIRLKGQMDGIELAEKIRKIYRIPIIYLTAYADNETLKRAKVTEPFGYILKPFEIRELQSNIEMAVYKNEIDKKLLEHQQHLNNLVNSTSEIIFSIDTDKNITTWNTTAEILMGFSSKDVIKKNIDSLNIIENIDRFNESIDDILKGKKVKSLRIIFKTKYDDKIVFQVSNPALLKDADNQNLGIVFVGEDITSDYENIDQINKGNGYLLIEKTNKSFLELLKTLSKLNNQCLHITRYISNVQKRTIAHINVTDAYLRSSEHKNHRYIPNLEDLLNYIKSFIKQKDNPVIFIERVDYLITKFSFDQFIITLYDIKDVISDTNSILVLYVDPLILNERQMALIKDELLMLPDQRVDDVTVGDDLFRILRFIFYSKSKNTIVTVKKIKKELSLSYPTISKRLKLLHEDGLILMGYEGKLKTVKITKKGEKILDNINDS